MTRTIEYYCEKCGDEIDDRFALCHICLDEECVGYGWAMIEKWRYPSRSRRWRAINDPSSLDFDYNKPIEIDDGGDNDLFET